MADLLSTASEFINTTVGSIFLTGKAGTGKTTFLKSLKQLTHKRFIVVAPTGIAALNAGGVTIHSQFLLPPLTYVPDRNMPAKLSAGGRFINSDTLARKHPLNSARKQVLRSIDLLVIDEVSMLRADLLDAIDYRMKAARGNFKQSFGGAQVLFIGDLFQLPPVIRNDERAVLSKYYKSAWFYDAHALQENPPTYIELQKIFRQHDDAFIHILNNLRNNTLTKEDVETLNQHFKKESEIQQLREVITLTTHNNLADEINRRELNRLQTPSKLFHAVIQHDFPESMYPAAEKIELKEGAQIMFTRNDSDKQYVNGQLATVKEITKDEVWVEAANTHEVFTLKKVTWQNKRYVHSTNEQEVKEEVLGTFEQFPIKLAWAITVHKSQGLTFDKAIIDVGQAFSDGQVYVALSRLRSLDGLILRTRINPSVVSVDQQVVAFVKAHHLPEQLDNTMKKRQQEFIFHLLDRTFDFSEISKEIQYHLRHVVFDEQPELPLLAQLVQAFDSERENTAKFKNQLHQLLQQQEKAQLLERLQKGSAYYEHHVFKQLEKLWHHMEEVKQYKRVKTYLNELEEVDQVMSKKIEEIEKSAQLVQGILEGSTSFDFEQLTNHRIQKRMNRIAEIKQSFPQDVEPTKQKTFGGKPKRKGKKKDEPSTYELTLELVKKGKTIEQIANERNLAVGTIEGHFARLISQGHVAIEHVLSEAEQKEILEAIKQMPENFAFGALFEKLEKKYSYGKIRAMMAHIEFQKKKVENV